MTKFANAIRRKLSSEVAFVERQKLMKSFQTPVSGFPDKPKAAFSWPNELKQFHSIWQTYSLWGTGSKSQSENDFLGIQLTNLELFTLNLVKKVSMPKWSWVQWQTKTWPIWSLWKAELISWGSLPQMENLWDSLTLIAESREHTSAWYHSPYKSSYVLTQCLRLSHFSMKSLS